MRESRAIAHEFVESVPADREEGKLYLSMRFRTAIHSCFCGCGTKVVTPLKPSAWQMLFDGDTVSLYPSIGNSGHACGAHYWIRRGWAVRAGQMTDEEIAGGRARDQSLQDAYYGAPTPNPVADQPTAAPVPSKTKNLWSRLFGGR